MLNIYWYRTTEPSCVDVQQTNKRFRAKAKQTLILFDHDGNHYAALIERQKYANTNKNTNQSSLFLSTGLTVAVKK